LSVQKYRLDDLSKSTILKHDEMRIQVYDELSKLHPDLDGIKLLLSPDLNTWTAQDVWQSCKDFD
jgi:hypothetical protein